MRYYIFSRPVDAQALRDLVRGHWGVENGRHRTLACRAARTTAACAPGHAPAVMGILRRAALNRLRMLQQNFSQDVSIGRLRDRIGRRPSILAAALP